MEKKIKVGIGIALVGSLVLVSLVGSIAYALPGMTVKVNGKISGILQTPNGPADDTIVIELKAKADGSSFVGSGSLHGINCGATFFFEVLTVNVGARSITFEGVVSSANHWGAPFVGFAAMEFYTNLEGDSMTLTISIPGEEGNLIPIFIGAGSGSVVL